ncbi:MAG: acyltransferase [Variovorax sp.]
MRASGSQGDHDKFLETRSFAALDGLRAVSVFLVYTFHFGGPAWARLSGWLGVYAFFVLSGFLITTLLVRERDATGRVSLKAFYIRRSTRILPLYLLVYLVVLAQSWFAQGEPWAQMKAATPYYLTFLNEFADLAPLHMTWTLGVEWKYYLVWPLLFALFGATVASRFTTAIGCAIVLAAIWLSHIPPAWFSPWHYLGMMVGSLVAIAMHTRGTFRWARALMRDGVALAIALALFVIHRKSVVIANRLGEPQMIALYTVLVGLWLPSLMARTGIGRVLGRQFLVFIGQRSYAMYLVQYLAAQAVIAMLPGTVAGPLLLGGAFVLALVVSDLLYRAFEKPLTQWGRRWAKAAKREPRPEAGGSHWQPLS